MVYFLYLITIYNFVSIDFPELPTFHGFNTFEVIKPPRTRGPSCGTSLTSSNTENSSVYEWIPLENQRILYSNTYIVSTETDSGMSNLAEFNELDDEAHGYQKPTYVRNIQI